MNIDTYMIKHTLKRGIKMHPSTQSLSDYEEYCAVYDTYEGIKLASHLKECYEEIEVLAIKDNLVLIKGGKYAE